MATKRKANTTEPVSAENPRLLERVSDGARTRATDPVEYLNLTTAYGYRDITDAKTSTSTSSNTGTGSGSSTTSTTSGTTSA